MANLTYLVQSISTAGADRVNVQLVQEQDTTAPGTPAYGTSNLNLNLANADAASYQVNQRYTMSLTQISSSSAAPSGA